MESFDFITVIVALFCILFSLSVHEWAHGFSAYKFGDNTAKQMGRLTLSPIAHIDVLGTIILPLFSLISGWPLFGWAKPVPVNPSNFKGKVSPRKKMMLVAFAGPLSNLLMAISSLLLISFLADNSNGISLLDSELKEYKSLILTFVKIFFPLNVALFIFNMLPLPPLDGSRIVEGVLPPSKINSYYKLERYSFLILLAILWFAPSVISIPIQLTSGILKALFLT